VFSSFSAAIPTASNIRATREPPRSIAAARAASYINEQKLPYGGASAQP
jgi:hypothetical protein